jgi:hypothetical protein
MTSIYFVWNTSRRYYAFSLLKFESTSAQNQYFVVGNPTTSTVIPSALTEDINNMQKNWKINVAGGKIWSMNASSWRTRVTISYASQSVGAKVEFLICT